MRLRIVGLTVAGIIVHVAGAFAQNLPEQFVVSGKAAENIQDFTTINLATAERIANTCQQAATAENVRVSIMVLDKDGNHVYMDRMDGQGYLHIMTAEMKARTALLERRPSKYVMNLVIQDPGRELEEMKLGEFATAGGLPIVVKEQMIGVIGVGGSAPRVPVWSDEICAHNALVDVVGSSVAPLLQDLPPVKNPNPGNAPVPRFAATTLPKSSVPAEFVTSGKDAGNVFDGNQISLEAAKKIARGCRDWAASKGGEMSIYVLDSAGVFVHIERMDGQTAISLRAALLKAQTALKTRQPTSILAAQLKNNPSRRALFFVNFDLFQVPGGIPIVVDGQMIGAVGVDAVSVGAEDCAIKGLTAAFGDHVTLPVYPAPTSAAQ
jgi:glc operon protein GlcG